MCNRIGLSRDIDAIRIRFGVAERHAGLKPSGLLAPGATLPVIRRGHASGARRLNLMRWGLVSAWSKDALVVRSHIHGAETGEPAPSGHCLVPVDNFIEWRTGDKQPFTVALANGEIMALAALWRIWFSPLGEHSLRFALLTIPSNPALAAFGKRMPAILSPEDWGAWLDEASPGLPRPISSTLLTIQPAQKKTIRAENISVPSGS
jgi:putative SOS response-associated peptidase YedK